MSANFASGTVWTGDNLPVLRGMNDACVDLIYLDPPFNSNRNYEAPIGSKAAGAAFKDAWTLDDVDVHEHGELADRNPAAYAVIEAARQAHGKGMQSYLIFMAVRLMEMRRVLKPTGSIYLHCDPTASHYLKLLMDGVFGQSAFRCEITWRRTNTHNDAKHTFPNVADVILFYGPEDSRFNPIYEPHSSEYIAKFYRHDDQDGRGLYRLDNMASPNPRPNMMYKWKGYPCPEKGWRYQTERMQELHDQKRIHYPVHKDGSPDFTRRPCLKRYLKEQKGAVVGNVWDNIKPIGTHAKERTGYPTQKPLALLERIIQASSSKGDMVFDPFCGCATSLVAADRLQRGWAGVDLSPLAVKLVNDRIKQDRGLWGGVTALTEPPKRTDLGKLPNYRTHRHRLYGEQEGVCVGCETHFPFRVMDVDHILPRSKGGTDHPDNLQLLCSGCNRSKGGRTMAEWKASQ
ncbi:MAG: HNH endonuclease [Rhodospirillales bacterium]|nr:HNH endonuclease [Rhodospirillales bacterium]